MKRFGRWLAENGLSLLTALVAAVALAVSIVALSANRTESLGSNSSAIRQLCLSWAQFVIGEQHQHVPDSRIDQEGALFSRATLGLLSSDGTLEPPHDSILDLCGSAQQLRSIRGR